MNENLLKRAFRRLGVLKPPVAVEDGRSRRFLAVIECALNQNVRDAGAARFPAMNAELLELCREYQVGLLQMPCPEVAALGMRRTRKPGQRIRDALDTEAGRACCANLAHDVAERIALQCAEADAFIGVLGGNPLSPGCAVHHQQAGERSDLSHESGLLMQALQEEFRKRAMPVRFMAMRDHDPALLVDDLQRLREILTERAIAQ